MISHRKLAVVFAVLISLFGTIFPATTQDDAVPALTPITVDSISQITELHRIGRSWIKYIDLSSDGKTLAVTTTLGVWLYDAGNLQAEPTLVETDNGVDGSVVFSAQGQRIMFYGDRKLMQVWDVFTKTVIAELSDVSGFPVFSADGKWLAYTTPNQAIQLWDIEHKKMGMLLSGYEAAIYDMAFSPDSALLASQGSDGKVRIWKISTGTPLTAIDNYGYRLIFSPDGSLLAFADGGKDRVIVWNIAEEKEEFALDILPGNGIDLAFSPDGSRLATANETFYGSTDDAVKVWDMVTGKQVGTLGKATLGSITLAWTPDGQSLFIGSQEDVQRWDVTQQTQTDITSQHFHAIRSMDISPDESLIAASYAYGKLRFFDTHTFKLLATFGGHNMDDEIFSLIFSPDGTRLATLSDPLGISRPNKLSLWDVATQSEVWSFEADIYGFAFSPSGNMLAISVCETYYEMGCTSSSIRFWDVMTNSEQKGLQVADDVINHLAFDPVSNTFAYAGEHTVYLRDASSGDLQVSARYPGVIRGIGFDGDGSLLLASAADDVSGYPLRLWRESDGLEIPAWNGQLQLRWDDHFAFHFVFSQDGSLLVSHSYNYEDGALSLWDTATHTQIGQLEGHTQSVTGLILNRAGDLLWSSSSDGTIRLWGVPSTP